MNKIQIRTQKFKQNPRVGINYDKLTFCSVINPLSFYMKGHRIPQKGCAGRLPIHPNYAEKQIIIVFKLRGLSNPLICYHSV